MTGHHQHETPPSGAAERDSLPSSASNGGKRPTLFQRMLRKEVTPERYTAIWKRYWLMFPNGPFKR